MSLLKREEVSKIANMVAVYTSIASIILLWSPMLTVGFTFLAGSYIINEALRMVQKNKSKNIYEHSYESTAILSSNPNRKLEIDTLMTICIDFNRKEKIAKSKYSHLHPNDFLYQDVIQRDVTNDDLLNIFAKFEHKIVKIGSESVTKVMRDVLSLWLPLIQEHNVMELSILCTIQKQILMTLGYYEEDFVKNMVPETIKAVFKYCFQFSLTEDLKLLNPYDKLTLTGLKQACELICLPLSSNDKLILKHHLKYKLLAENKSEMTKNYFEILPMLLKCSELTGNKLGQELEYAGQMYRLPKAEQEQIISTCESFVNAFFPATNDELLWEIEQKIFAKTI